MSDAEKDQAEIEAEELLPCFYDGTNLQCDPEANRPYCAMCQKRPSVAAALRKRDDEIRDHCVCVFKVNLGDYVCVEVCKYHDDQLAAANAEIKRLNGLAGLYLVDLDILRAEIAQLKAQLKEGGA